MELRRIGKVSKNIVALWCGELRPDALWGGAMKGDALWDGAMRRVGKGFKEHRCVALR
jgi:hypothetical protein